MTDDSAAHILIVDDDTRIRTLLRNYLQDGGYRVTTAADAAQARKKLASLAFDLAILDVMMPGESGLELAKHLSSERSMPLLILSARGTAEDRIAGLEHGVDDYLPKPFEPRELLLRIENLLRRKFPGQNEKIEIGSCVYNCATGELRRNDKKIILGGREAALLHILAKQPGMTISRAELAANAGGVTERTVDVYINRLRRKIEDNPASPVYLLTMRGIGYALHA